MTLWAHIDPAQMAAEFASTGGPPRSLPASAAAYAGGSSAAQYYWDSLDKPQRPRVLALVEMVAPFASLHEIGCASGPNLRLLAVSYPSAVLSGCDKERHYVEWAQAQGLDVVLEDVTVTPPRAADVQLLCSVLEVRGAHEVGYWAPILRHALMQAARAVVILTQRELDVPAWMRAHAPEWHLLYDDPLATARHPDTPLVRETVLVRLA